jgi:predicted Mrr-cat superfamily restriction endonuclease
LLCARWGFRIWDGVDLRDELFLNYEHLPAEAKARIPLERVRVLNEDALS